MRILQNPVLQKLKLDGNTKQCATGRRFLNLLTGLDCVVSHEYNLTITIRRETGKPFFIDISNGGIVVHYRNRIDEEYIRNTRRHGWTLEEVMDALPDDLVRAIPKYI